MKGNYEPLPYELILTCIEIEAEQGHLEVVLWTPRLYFMQTASTGTTRSCTGDVVASAQPNHRLRAA
ncbi:hypothetical protein V6N12_070523 [Hibiscus sabdariffa]|uniref:Uncharacterized protein n=1 Tax=Hibiscus sabdariffa TaxID=183260 RepID=A0ABR2FH25_9ROSI